MKLLSSQSGLASNAGISSGSSSLSSRSSLLLALSFVHQITQISLAVASTQTADNSQAPVHNFNLENQFHQKLSSSPSSSYDFDELDTNVVAHIESIQSRLIDKCCQVGKERAINSQKFNCKLSAREALTSTSASNRDLSIALAESFLTRDSNFADQCEMVLESCCLAHHRSRNCNSGKQFAKSGASCMDVELSKEVTVATESFNDCCMSCSLGILAARNPSANETTTTSITTTASRLLFQNNVAQRCKLISPLALSLSGQLYEQTYTECCQENLPRISSALTEPGSPIDCAQSNPCSQRCVSAGSLSSSFDPNFSNRVARQRFSADKDRCDCFNGYKLASDGVNCVDIDECKSNQHNCNKQSEVCDNTRGGYRCLARQTNHSPTLSRSFLTPFSDEDSGGEFVSLRLCPLGSRWSTEEKRCVSTSSGPTSLLSENGFNQARSASLFSSSSLHLIPEPTGLLNNERLTHHSQ